MLLVSGGGKVLDLPFSRGNRDKLNVHPLFWRVTGGLELAALVGLVWGIWFVPFAIAAAIGLVLLMIGALVFRARTGDRTVLREGVADVVVLVVAVVVLVLDFLTLAR
jgi:uncharacterized membrane protein